VYAGSKTLVSEDDYMLYITLHRTKEIKRSKIRLSLRDTVGLKGDQAR